MSTKKIQTKETASKAITKKTPVKKASAKKPIIRNSSPNKARINNRVTLSSPKVSSAFEAASLMLSDADRFKRLVSAGVEKISSVNPDAFKENWAYLTAMVRLLSAYRKGHYREVPWKSLVAIGGAVVYVVNPLDLIPDAIPVAGLADDAAVISFALRVVKGDLDRFMTWETTD